MLVCTMPCPFGLQLMQSPSDVQACVGGNAVFSVEAEPSANVAYQWYSDEAPLPENAHYAGTRGPVLTIVGVTPADAGAYRCIVRTFEGSVSSGPATLTVCAADFNCDGIVNSQDFFDYVNSFFSHEPASDFNGDGSVNSQDFFDFMVVFFIGC